MLTSLLLLQAAFPQPALQPFAPSATDAGSPAPAVQGSEDDGVWTREADVGITILEGNTESTNSAANVVVGWEGGLQRWQAGAHYAAVRQEDGSGGRTTTSRMFLYDASYDHFFSDSKNFYGFAKGAHRTNTPTGLDHRNDIGVGLGYGLDLTETATASFEAGVSYVWDEKVGTPEESAAAFRGAYRFDTPFSESISLVNAGEYLTGDNIETFTHDLGLRWTMDADVYLQFSYNITWDDYAAPGFVSTDRRYVLVFGMSF